MEKGRNDSAVRWIRSQDSSGVPVHGEEYREERDDLYLRRGGRLPGEQDV